MVEMQWKGLEQDVTSCSALIGAGAESEDNVEKALQLLVKMLRKGLEQDVITHITYNALLNTCAKGSNAAKASQLLVEMRRKGLESDVITFGALIQLRSERGYCGEGFAADWWKCSGRAWCRV